MKNKIDIVLMASGESRRFEKGNKLLYETEGKPLFLHALERAVGLRKALPDIIEEITVVSVYDEIKVLSEGFEDIRYVYNPNASLGISGSIHLGLSHSHKDNSVMFMVCDQPYLSSETLKELVKGYIFSGKSLGCIISPRGMTSNPCIFSPLWKDKLMAIQGDRGGKSIINQNRDSVYFYTSYNKGDFYDIDTLDTPALSDNFGGIISLVGGGGKTSLMYKLGEIYSRKGFKVLLTTTTHIYEPEALPVARSKKELSEAFKEKNAVVLGERAEGGKLRRSPELEDCLGLADIVIIEADGAKGLSCKAPESHEPVIIPQSDTVIALAGIDATGKRLADSVFRSERAMELLGADKDHIMTEEDIVAILSSPKGGMKHTEGKRYIALINKCDSEELRKKGKRIKDMLSEKGIDAHICSLKENFYE